MTVVAADLGGRPDLSAESADPRSTRIVGWFSTVALVPIIAAHVVGAAVVDPVLDPISWYAFVPGGGEMIMAGGAILALLGLLLTARMYRTGLAVGPVPACAMIVFAVSMILVGAFPTDPPGVVDTTLSAVIHRVSAAAAFCVLPLVGLSLRSSIRQPRSELPAALRTAAVALGIVVTVFLVVHMSLVFVGSGIFAFGLIERIGFVIMIGYLYLLAATLDREAPRDLAELPGMIVEHVDDVDGADEREGVLSGSRSVGLVA